MEFDSIFNKKEEGKEGMASRVKKHLKEQDEHDLAALKSALENLFNEVEEDKVSARRAALSPACRVDLTGRLLAEGPLLQGLGSSPLPCLEDIWEGRGQDNPAPVWRGDRDRGEDREEQLKRENRELRWRVREGERLVEELEEELEREGRAGKKLRTRLIVLDGEYRRDHQDLEESHLRLRRLEDKEAGRRRQLTALVRERDNLTIEGLRKEQEVRRLLQRKEELRQALAAQGLLGRWQEVELGQQMIVIELLLHSAARQERRIQGLEKREVEKRVAGMDMLRDREETRGPWKKARGASEEAWGAKEEARGANEKTMRAKEEKRGAKEEKRGANEEKRGAKDMVMETCIQKENPLKQKKEVATQYSEEVQEKKTHVIEKFGEDKAKIQTINVSTILAMCKREGLVFILCDIASVVITQDLVQLTNCSN